MSTTREVLLSVHDKIKRGIGYEMGVGGSGNFRASGPGRVLWFRSEGQRK